jgi:arylsulfatase A-like enzyme
MTDRHRSTILILTALLLVPCLALRAAEPADSKAKPNILLVVSDDHSVPHVGAYGDANCLKNQITPNLDKFAKEGMCFTRAYTAAPQCAPSRIALFTGRSPVGLASTRFGQPPIAQTPFFTDLLRKSGYWVGLDGRNHHLDGRNSELPHVDAEMQEQGMRGPLFAGRFDHVMKNSTKGAALEKVPALLGSALDEVANAKPFFLYFGFNQPHRNWGEDHAGIDPEKLTLPPDWPDLPEVRLDYARYLADVRDLDRGFGMAMKLLKDRGLDENTIVIFIGDNGESLLRGKGTLYRRGLNVPLIIRWPDHVKPGSTSDVLVSGEDLAPTILASAGIEPAKGMSGISFLPVLLGQAFTGRDHLFAERGFHAGPITRTDGFDLSRSVVTRRYNFIYNALPDRAYWPVDMDEKNIAWEAVIKAHEAGTLPKDQDARYFSKPRPAFELYDLEVDPFELHNLAGQDSVKNVEDELRKKMDRWMVREGDSLPLASESVPTKGKAGKE